MAPLLESRWFRYTWPGGCRADKRRTSTEFPSLCTHWLLLFLSIIPQRSTLHTCPLFGGNRKRVVLFRNQQGVKTDVYIAYLIFSAFIPIRFIVRR